MSTVVALAYFIAVIIPVFYIYIMFNLDFFGTSKRSILIICTVWGAIGAFGLARQFNFQLIDDSSLVPILTAPIFEEILKALILVYFVSTPQFRYIVDGAIYGFSVGIGFAALENVDYIANDLAAGDTAGGALSLAVSRVLSTALMHATASGIVGLSIGALRRVRTPARRAFDVAGILIAIGIHMIFNNLVNSERTLWGDPIGLEGPPLLLVAVTFGIGGGAVIAFLINQELAEEKERFATALGLDVGVSSGEVAAVQNVGSTAMEGIFKEMEDNFGAEKVVLIRRLLTTQANIGILRNNLKAPSTQRLKKAWEEEIEELQAEVDELRGKLGVYVNSFMNNVFPANDNPLWQQELGKFDPTMVHTFDTFMRVSELAHSFTPEELAELADRLSEIDIFANVSLANLESLSRAIAMSEYEDGAMVFDQGDEGDGMYLVKEGAIDIILVQPDGSEKFLKTLGEGTVVGEFSVLDGETRSARARAKGTLKVGILQRQTFLMFIQSRPQVILAMLQYLASKARYTTKSVEDSINYAQIIADGEYEKLRQLAAQTKQVRAINPDTLLQQKDDEVVLLSDDGEPVDINENTSEILCRTFAEVADKIEEHERELKELA